MGEDDLFWSRGLCPKTIQSTTDHDSRGGYAWNRIAHAE